MKFQVTIDCDNAAFGDDAESRDAEVSRILTLAANKIDKGGHLLELPLFDANGNRVGSATFTD